jgi:hypothetical protein
MSLTVAEDILSVLQGEQPKFLANPEVWVRRRRPEAAGTDLGEA